MKKINCWEFKQCERQPGGSNAAKPGVCPAATTVRADGINNGVNGGRICWAIAGTYCESGVQATFAEKLSSCQHCDFFQKVQLEEGLASDDASMVPNWFVSGKRTEKIKTRIMVPFVLVLTVILLILAISSFWLVNQRKKENILHYTTSVGQLFPTLVAHDARFMTRQIEILLKSKALQQAWLKKDRSLLLNNAQPIFSELLNKYNITHFYFHSTDKTAFLRVHKPTMYGDVITRFTLYQALESGLPAEGIEIGPLGTLTLRVVMPWIIDGKLSGFMELGMEVSHIIPKLKEALGAEIFIIIKKSLVTRAGWDEERRVHEHGGDWDLFPDCVIVDHTMESIPQNFSDLVVPAHSEGKDINLDFTYNGRDYFSGFVPLIDASNHEVGDLIVLTDITSDKRMLKIIFTILLCGYLAAMGVAYYLFSFFLSRVEKDLVESNDQVASEIQKRLEIEKDLRQEKQAREKLITDLQRALAEVKTLKGIIPICASCKKIRDDKGFWNRIEVYIEENSEAEFSHGMCQECTKKLYPEEYEVMYGKEN